LSNSSSQSEKLHHGGRLRAAAKRYSIPLADWLDLSTGINPHGWQAETIPANIWQRLPEEEDELVEVACDYYGAPSLLPVAGSQAAIQALPQLRARSRVSMLTPSYAEHALTWRRAGHQVSMVAPQQINAALPHTDVLVLVRPNNPTGFVFPTEQLLDWHARLADRNGWLIVDEAFMDMTPEQSITSYAASPGLIVLRSLGKFFGLAGARVGFVCAQSALLSQLNHLLGPWTVNTPARWVAVHALQDAAWQAEARSHLLLASNRLRTLLIRHQLAPAGGCGLFQWSVARHAAEVYEALASQGILVRYLNEPPSLRFGLPAHESDWQRLDRALAQINHKIHPLAEPAP